MSSEIVLVPNVSLLNSRLRHEEAKKPFTKNRYYSKPTEAKPFNVFVEL